MSRPLVTLAVINTFTTAIFAYIYNYYIQSKSSQDKKIESLAVKIQQLERSINIIQQSIEDLEENLNLKNNKVIESNIALSSKLVDFINYSYDVCDD
jgi:cell division protein FtsB